MHKTTIEEWEWLWKQPWEYRMFWPAQDFSQMETAEHLLSDLIVLQILCLASIPVQSDSPREEEIDGFAAESP